jgi:hypothetical protein
VNVCGRVPAAVPLQQRQLQTARCHSGVVLEACRPRLVPLVDGEVQRLIVKWSLGMDAGRAIQVLGRLQMVR